MGTCNHADSQRKQGSSEYLQPPNHGSTAALQRWDGGEDEDPNRLTGKGILVSKCVGILLVRGGYVQSFALVCAHVGQILCVCERQRGIVSNRERVYCSQMWRGMWRVGMQWLLKLSRPSFSFLTALCPHLMPHSPKKKPSLPLFLIPSFFTVSKCCLWFTVLSPHACMSSTLFVLHNSSGA